MKKLILAVLAVIAVFAGLKAAFDAVAIYHVALLAHASSGTAMFEAGVASLFSFVVMFFIGCVFCVVIGGFIFAFALIFSGAMSKNKQNPPATKTDGTTSK